MSEESMRRTPGVSYEPDDRADVEDFVADYARDAIDAGVAPVDVVIALRQAADGINEAADRGDLGNQEADR